MNEIYIVNLKCEGCATTIKKSLEKQGLEKVMVYVKENKVTYEGNTELATKTLSKLGYPEVGSLEADKFLKSVKSYISCAKGRL